MPNPLSRLLRLATLAGATALLLVSTAAPATAADSPRLDRFFADHTRDCVYSFTEGILDWYPSQPQIVPGVLVTGVLAERRTCRLAPGQTFAEFTAWVGDRMVDYETVWFEPQAGVAAPLKFSFWLRSHDASRGPWQVDVRVCRTLGPMLPAFTCGKTQTYRSPLG